MYRTAQHAYAAMCKAFNKMKKTRQILAWIGIVLLIALYISAMVLAFMGGERAQELLGVAIFCTFVVPIMLWVYTFLYQKVKEKKDQDQP